VLDLHINQAIKGWGHWPLPNCGS